MKLRSLTGPERRICNALFSFHHRSKSGIVNIADKSLWNTQKPPLMLVK